MMFIIGERLKLEVIHEGEVAWYHMHPHEVYLRTMFFPQQKNSPSLRVRVRTARTVEREGMTINVSSLLQTHSAKIFN